MIARPGAGRAAAIGLLALLVGGGADGAGRMTGGAPEPGAASGRGMEPGRGPGAGDDAADASPRVRFTVNDGWRFAAGDLEGAAATEFDDSAWTPVSLPHTWNAEDALTEAVGYRRGTGWYRKHLALDASLRNRRIFLRFEGANQVADVFVNGRPAGRHVGGYTAFAFDVTDDVRFDAPNVIAVRVDNAHDEDIPPLNADFTFYGGIYRDVWLIATSAVHVTLLDHASPGVFIDTPEVSEAHATARIRGTIVNHERRDTRVTVTSGVLDGSGAAVAVVRTALAVPAGGSASFHQVTPRVAAPRLWSPDEPNLYRVVTEVSDRGRIVDRVENPLGFRWFRVDPERGFFLNGRSHPLYGTNRHQDRPGLGSALPDAAHREDVALVKATGFNFLRLAHYPQDAAVLEAMDRRGLIGWEEIPVVNIISLSPAFADNAERMLVEMIRQHYNHPSIVFWGYMNEVLLRKPTPMPDGYIARVRQLAERLEARVWAEDSTRVTAIAVSFDEIDDGSGVQDVARVLGLNLYFGWYYRTIETFGPYLDSLHARHPTRPLLISEYGAGSDERIHTLEPGAFDFSTEHQQRFHEATFRQIRERAYLTGSAVWNQFDFGSKGRHDSKPNINQKGLLYFDRRPKDVWQYYRASLREEPVLHIAARDWPRRAGSRPEDARQPVTVYTNLPEVELLANGTSLGRQPGRGAARWTVPLQPGANRLEARAPGSAPDAFTVTYDDRATFFTDAGSPVTVMAVNAGSHYQYTDAAGLVWEADRPFTPGGWGHTGGEPQLRHHRIFGSDDDPLYQSQLEGMEQYRFAVPDGSYEVQLRFAEMEHAAAGQRVFDVVVNGHVVFGALDLAGRYGRHAAVERTVVVEAAGGSGLTIGFTPSAGRATISGILLRRM
ncbi:MAG TPA: glycoside hydrolase family 2 TIM barrel-domain containing protein [Longimicrobiales bacterium]|nr:glycoside hydrolase family 2 TIM barrel-domain containing protein [Longimicrobiales bacterium]